MAQALGQQCRGLQSRVKTPSSRQLRVLSASVNLACPALSSTRSRLFRNRNGARRLAPCAAGGSSHGFGDDEVEELLRMIRQNGLKGDSGSESNSSPGGSGGEEAKGAADGNEVQETLADLMQMEVRRVRAKEELASDMELKKEEMRAIGEEMKAALAREYELDRMRTELGATYAISEAMAAFDDVEADIARIKRQVQADKADLEAWEEQSARDRSKGLFFKSLYAKEKEPRQPVGKSIPGLHRKAKAAAEAAAAAAAASAVDSPAAPGTGTGTSQGSHQGPSLPSSLPSPPTRSTQHDTAAASEQDGEAPAAAPPRWDPEEVAAAAERPLSAASRQVRSPFRLYLFSYLSAFLALMVVNDIAAVGSSPDGTGPHVARDALYGVLSAGLGAVAIFERQALGAAQQAMLDGIRKRAGAAERGDKERSRRR